MIFFSEKLKLEDFDLSDRKHVIENFSERIKGYYFRPIETLNNNKHAFASGALLCLLIDAFSRYSSLEERVGIRFVSWCKENIEIPDDIAKQFYDFFRCGLLHESHVKSFGQFTYDNDHNKAIQEKDGFIIANPYFLFKELEKYFQRFIEKINIDDALYETFISRLKVDFEEEVNLAKRL